MFTDGYSYPVDMWSLGVIFVELLLAKTMDTIDTVKDLGLARFTDDNFIAQLHSFQKVGHTRFFFFLGKRKTSRGYSEILCGMIPKLLCKNPASRIQVPALLQEILRALAQMTLPSEKDLNSVIKVQHQVLAVAQEFNNRLGPSSDRILARIRDKPTIAVVPMVISNSSLIKQYGPTGSGKSTFLNRLLGQEFLETSGQGIVSTCFAIHLEYHDDPKPEVIPVWLREEDWKDTVCIPKIKESKNVEAREEGGSKIFFSKSLNRAQLVVRNFLFPLTM